MLEFLKKLFTSEPNPDYSELLKKDGIIVDVRTRNEYSGGHIKGSKNIPLNSLTSNLSILKKKDQPIITCCASGMRSANARSILKSYGYTNVYNGGSWRNLNTKVS